MKIIINADDFGFTRGTNEAVFELARIGTLTSTTVMTNMPFAEEAKRLLEQRRFTVGLHLNLTQGSPVSPPESVPSLVGTDGSFHDLKTLAARAKSGQLKAADVDTEMQAQWRKLHGIISDAVSHMDSHQGLNRIPFIFDRTLAFLKSHPVRAVRFYVKYYAVGSGNGARIEQPGITSIQRYGPKRILVETYLKRRRKRLCMQTSAPDGMLVSRSHDTRDLFKWMCEARPGAAPDRVLEIPCHPAANTEGLVDTKYTTERVEEFELLRSEAFRKAAGGWNLADYTAASVSR